MITVSVTIARPPQVVWDYFITSANWRKWSGGEIVKVMPAWQKGAHIVWTRGGASLITTFVPGREISWANVWVDTNYKFTPTGASSTIVQLTETPKGGAFFTDGGAAQRAQLQSFLQSLKRTIEVDALAPAHSRAPAQKDKSSPTARSTGEKTRRFLKVIRTIGIVSLFLGGIAAAIFTLAQVAGGNTSPESVNGFILVLSCCSLPFILLGLGGFTISHILLRKNPNPQAYGGGAR